MYLERLYSLAFAVRKTKLWKALYDDELFAVSLSNGKIGYCSVMGALGEHLALALYVGNRGLDSYRLFQGANHMEMNALKTQEFMLSQVCLQCSFESKEELSPGELDAVRKYAAEHQIALRGANAFPQFMSYQAAHYPWPVSGGTDEKLLCEILEAALEVSARLKEEQKSALGFSEGPAYDRSIPLLTPAGEKFQWSLHPLPPKQPVSYPTPSLRDELLMMRLKKTRRSSSTWACDVVMTPEPFAPEDGSAPVFPYMLLAANCETGLILPTDIVTNYKDEADALVWAVGNRMLEEGIPKRICVIDDRTYALLKNIATTLKIKIERQQENNLLDTLEEDLLDCCDGQDTDGNDDSADGFFEMFMSLDDDTLLSMPDELWHQLQALERQGLLADDIAMRVRSLSKARR